jgi:hypothetical protein
MKQEDNGQMVATMGKGKPIFESCFSQIAHDALTP